jgi:hypothetical protein
MRLLTEISSVKHCSWEYVTLRCETRNMSKSHWINPDILSDSLHAIPQWSAAYHFFAVLTRSKIYSNLNTERLNAYEMNVSHFGEQISFTSVLRNFATSTAFLIELLPADSCLFMCTLSTRIYCTRCKWIFGCVVPHETVCEMLQSFSSLTAKHTNSSVVG